MKNATKRERQINTLELVNNKEKREEYQSLVSQKLQSETEKDWKEVKEIITNTAADVVGLEEKQRGPVKHDIQIAELSRQQKEIKVKISNTNDATKITELRQNVTDL